MLRFRTRIRGFEKLKAKSESAFKFGQFVLDNSVIRDSNYFIPTDLHFLERSAIMHSVPGSGRVVWMTDYARRLYYNPQYNFSHDVNPHAQGLWFEAAKALYKDVWLDEAEKAIKSKI